MKVGTLYSGIGGADAGLSAAGWEIVFQAEKDPFRQQVLQQHWPSATQYPSIQDAPRPLPDVDVIYAELPDARIGLWWPPLLDVALYTPPKWLVIECSPSVPIDGMLRELVLADMWFRIIQAGLTLRTSSLPEREWHIRQRLFIMASRDRANTDGLMQRGFSVRMEYDLGPLTAPRGSMDFCEQSIGIKGGWTCVCDSELCECPREQRLAALREATPPLLSFWLAHMLDGRWRGEDMETNNLQELDQSHHAK